MPTRFPAVSISAPPELPGLIAASVWHEILEGIDSELAPAESRNDAHRYGLPHAEGVAYREHHIAHAQASVSTEGNRRDGPTFDLQNRDVGFRIGADGLGL